MMDRLLDFLFPALARRRALICKLLERKRASRAYRDIATGELRLGTAKVFRKLCEERARYLARDAAAEGIVLDRVSQGA